MKWGLVTGQLEHLGRQRGLGLIRVVRYFNELAVPGLGGLSFGKQLLWPLLGLRMHEVSSSRVSRTRLAEAVEGWACLKSWKATAWQPDPRLRGRIKLRALEHESDAFRKLTKPGVYVRQPMRMKVVQPLYELGFVNADAARFSLYTCSEPGLNFLDAALGKNNHARVAEWTNAWLTGETRYERTIHPLVAPLEPLPEQARHLLRHHIVTGDSWQACRRRNALTWVRQIRRQQALAENHSPSDTTDAWHRPDVLDDEHWDDIRTGATFFRTRDAAVRILALLESCIASTTPQTLDLETSPVPRTILNPLDELARLAQRAEEQLTGLCSSRRVSCSLQQELIDMTLAFLTECQICSPKERLLHLVRRDGRTLQLADGRRIEPGPAFRTDRSPAGQSQGGEETDSENIALALGPRWFPKWPGLSGRLPNLYLLACDLDKELDQALSPVTGNPSSHAAT